MTTTKGAWPMELLDAQAATNTIVDGLIAGLRPEHRELPTPCAKWNVHDLLGHMVGGTLAMAAALTGTEGPSPDDDPLADGPAQGWATASAALQAAATPENLAGLRPFPFGEMPGAAGLAVIVADGLTHAWDLARATGQPIEASADLCAWGLATWQSIIQDEFRNGDAFDVVQPVPEGARPIDELAAFTGRAVD